LKTGLVLESAFLVLVSPGIFLAWLSLCCLLNLTNSVWYSRTYKD